MMLKVATCIMNVSTSENQSRMISGWFFGFPQKEYTSDEARHQFQVFTSTDPASDWNADEYYWVGPIPETFIRKLLEIYLQDERAEKIEQQSAALMKAHEECEDQLDDTLQRIANIEQQNLALVKALKKAPEPRPPLSAEELKTDCKRIDHWFAVYDTWMDDIVKQALALAEGGKTLQDRLWNADSDDIPDLNEGMLK